MNHESIPECVGMIMDGNRRWAKERGLPTLEGHRRGYEKLKEVLQWVKDIGISHLIVYAFSTENWKRTQEEVGYLLDLFRLMLSKEVKRIKEEGGVIRCIGERERFPKDIQDLMVQAEAETKDGQGPTLVIALSYGGRAEILETVKRLAGKQVTHPTEKEFDNELWTRGIPDPDIVIRTGGEKRLSGFLTWQSVYSELFFTDTKWPDFSKSEFQAMLSEFSNRKRNFGK